MPLSRTQQQTADLFQATGAQESFAHTPARLTSTQQSGAVVSRAEKLSSRHVLRRAFPTALKQWDEGELARFFAAPRHELAYSRSRGFIVACSDCYMSRPQTEI